MKLKKLFVVFSALFSISFSSNAALLTFDDIAPVGFYNTIYDDFTLSRVGVRDWSGFGINQAYSANQSMINHYGYNMGMLTYNSGTFDFNGAYFHQDDRFGSRLVNVYGLDESNNILFNEQITATSSWIYHTFNWSGINKFKWSVANGSSNIGIDDFYYNMPIEDETLQDVSPVPVPAAAWLFGSALLGFIGFSRRKNKK